MNLLPPSLPKELSPRAWWPLLPAAGRLTRAGLHTFLHNPVSSRGFQGSGPGISPVGPYAFSPSSVHASSPPWLRNGGRSQGTAPGPSCFCLHSALDLTSLPMSHTTRPQVALRGPSVDLQIQLPSRHLLLIVCWNSHSQVSHRSAEGRPIPTGFLIPVKDSCIPLG